MAETPPENKPGPAMDAKAGSKGKTIRRATCGDCGGVRQHSVNPINL